MSPAAPPARDAAARPIAFHPWPDAGPHTSDVPSLPGSNSSLVDLTRRVKDELARRFERGERPSAAEYLERHPEIAADRDRAVSLIYEEYCLREEHDAAPNPDEFCRRYDAWRDSLASQLRYHRLLSSVLEPAKPPPRYPIPGETFAGRFVLRDLLGEGGTARVFLAEQPDMGGRRVALKVSASTGREPAILGRLEHDHIVPVWSIDDDPATGLRGLCMPYRPGLPLDRVLKRLDPRAPNARALAFWKAIQHPTDAPEPDPSQRSGWRGFPSRGTHSDAAAWVALVIARALTHAHSRGVLHRDIKPANILLTLAGPQLLDFNLADSDDDDPANAQKAMQGGTLPYMAPEQLHAFLDPTRWKEVGPPADLYSLGLVLREMLTGERPPAPPAGHSMPRLINDLLDLRARPHRWTRDDIPAVPHALAAIVAKCTAHATADRYPDAAALADDLERYLARRPLRHAVNPCRRERAANWLRRNRLRLASGVVLATLAVAAVHGAHAIADGSSAIRKSTQAERKLAERWLDENEVDAAEVARDPVRSARLNEIRALYERDAAADPDDYTALLNLAHIDESYADPRWSETERLERPLARYDRAIAILVRRPDLKPKYLAESYLNRGVIHLRLGVLAERAERLQDAADRFQAAIADVDHTRENFTFLDAFRRVRLYYVSAHARASLARQRLLRSDFATAAQLHVQAIDDLNKLDRLLDAVAQAPADASLIAPETIRKFVSQSRMLRMDVDRARSLYDGTGVITD